MAEELTDEQRDDLARKARQIEEHVASVRERLADWAMHMAARFNGAVYLLGSTLHNPKPRDVDIRIVISDAEFAAGAMSRHILENLDVKVWPESKWREGVYPTPIVLAAPSRRWFIYNKHVPDPSAKAAAE